MSILISVHKIKKSFSTRPLFDGLTFTIEEREHIGLIGPNGAGKSTLLKILAGLIPPDEGQVSMARGLKVGYLEQVPEFKENASVLDTVLEGADDPDDWRSINLAQTILSKLHLEEAGIDTSTPVLQLSGGWKKKVALARELAREPQLLLLDEPTNHLDLNSILWLEKYLADAPFGVITITHDRLFLQRIGNRIIELDRRNPGGILSVKGDYAHYLVTKEAAMSAQEERENILKNTMRRESEWLARGAKARSTKQQARIKRADQLALEVKELEDRNTLRLAQIDFQSSQRNPKKLIEAINIGKSFQGQELFAGLDFTLSPKDRVGILGENGCGKSTLLKILLGELDPDQGTVKRADNLSIAYFAQYRESLALKDPEMTVAKAVCPEGDYVTFQGNRIHIRGYLARFMFGENQVGMPLLKLSGGEQARVVIARLMLTTANVLVLDEPTNDLDLATLDILEECLKKFNGAILLVTHDRYFLDQVSTKILAFPPLKTQYQRGMRKLQGLIGLEQWEEWHEAQQDLIELQSKTTEENINQTNSSQTSQKKKKLSFKEQKELDEMEGKILEAEQLLALLVTESERPENASNTSRIIEITKKIDEVQSKINKMYERWSFLGESH